MIFRAEMRRLICIVGLLVSLLVVSQCWTFPFGKTLYFLSANMGSNLMLISNAADNANNLESAKIYAVEVVAGNDSSPSNSKYKFEYENGVDNEDYNDLESDGISNLSKMSISEKGVKGFGMESDFSRYNGFNQVSMKNESYEKEAEPAIGSRTTSSEARNQVVSVFRDSIRDLDIKRENENRKTELRTTTDSENMANSSLFRPKRWANNPTTLSQMNSLLLQSTLSFHSMRSRWSSVRDRELQSAKLEIENAPTIRNNPELSAYVFRNVSKFKRSHELMERLLKVYIYKEGEKPGFHQPYLRGIYASEGWFLKLMERSKKFVVRDAKKAHLFYLPFSSKMLRITFSEQKSGGKKDLEKYLTSYVSLISRKYRFWNRTGGADHFLVACHDWAPYITEKCMKNCIRALCNANVGKDFKIGKDSSLPVTYIRSGEAPLKDVGGKPASERSILAFFAGGMHGYLRPILLHYWQNKEPDMKVFGPMPRDIEGKTLYREYMKSSKYCICARGYEVHTPRVIEAIFYECVPVIISDNYVPPFFEVLNWEAFSVFVQEKDVHNLRNILLSIPNEKYKAMQLGVKMVQKHFFWHKTPVKYDLFHMTLHSVWNNRILQSFLFPYENALRSLFPEREFPINVKYNVLSTAVRSSSSSKSVMVRNPLTVYAGGELGFDTKEKENDIDNKEISFGIDGTSYYVMDRFVDNSFPFKDSRDSNVVSTALVSIKNEESDPVMGDDASRDQLEFSVEQIKEQDTEISKDNVVVDGISLVQKTIDGGSNTPFKHSTLVSSASASNNMTYLTASTFSENPSLAFASNQSDQQISKNNSAIVSVPRRKKMRCDMPPKSITTFQEMNLILVKHRAKSRSMRPRWSSVRDRDIMALKPQIEHAPTTNDQDLYAPLFRNVSMFKKSYELMERTLKVYVYKDGEKPIFHQPILKGLYASEGWFMKLMEGNRRFVVKDPRRAHLFYMPFSSRMLEHTLYVRNSHNRTNLRQYLKEYTEKISAKYPYFNRTGGADHFLVACHDWAPYETRHHMERCMKALCNADVTAGFKIGRDVSLPETYVRSARNPLRDLGGKPPSQRHILAFYAGSLHGYLRPNLLKYWKDKDPDMKIFGRMPLGVASKMDYIQLMKSSKYCICPKGYEVNSPRVVEAIFYECVPVIISDNFVPPFFDVLNWEAFSVVLAEKDIPRLKDILLAIPKDKYLEMQFAVRKAQKHFLWHAKPMNFKFLFLFAEDLMGDVHVSNEIYEIPSAAHDNAVNNTDVTEFNLSIDDIFTSLWTLTSCIGEQLMQFIEDLVLRDLNRCLENLVYYSPEQDSLDLRNICETFSKGSSSSSKPCYDCTLPRLRGRRAQEPREEFTVNTSSDIVEIIDYYAGSLIIFQGLLIFPIFGLQFVWRLALDSCRCSLSYIRCAELRIRSILSRIRKTLRGSSDDIGWLQQTPGMPSVTDGTARFLELLAEIRNGEHSLPNSYVYLLIPGLFSNHGPLYFVGTKRFFSKMGLACHIAKIHSEASVEHNAWELKQYIEELYWGSGKPVMLLGHSKGGVDAAAALSIYWSDLKDKVAGLALVQSPYGGTPIASDTLREGQIADKETRRIMELLICKLIKGDIRALEDLTYEKRKEFIMKYKLPEQVPLISFHTEASTAPGVLATMTQIAHAELPWLPLLKFDNEESDSFLRAGRQVPVVMPISAAMALCALHLQLRYGEKSDGLVTRRDAEVPGSVVVKPDRKLDHAWMVYSSSKKNPMEPDACEMCEALLTLLVEIGKKKQEEIGQSFNGLGYNCGPKGQDDINELEVPCKCGAFTTLTFLPSELAGGVIHLGLWRSDHCLLLTSIGKGGDVVPVFSKSKRVVGDVGSGLEGIPHRFKYASKNWAKWIMNTFKRTKKEIKKKNVEFSKFEDFNTEESWKMHQKVEKELNVIVEKDDKYWTSRFKPS
uniref:Exostosin GT47 domain-containing protein n=3 Tax=Cannabis sativa TaxID=3483 RepID=A0A803NSX8_CANSA